MKRFLVIAFVFSLVVISCFEPIEPVDTGARRFWAWNVDTGAPYRINANLLAYNTRVEIWVERARNINVTEAQAQAAADHFSDNIYPSIMEVFGWTDSAFGYVMNFGDIDRNGRIIILLLNIGGGVAGYFHPMNFFNHRNSNMADMIYIDAVGIGTQSFNEIIAHEFQHLINFITTLAFRAEINNNVITRLNQMDLWIDEGLSEGAQWIYSQSFLGGINEQRIIWYYFAPLHPDFSHQTRILQGNNFFVWDNSLDDYAAVNLFFNWLRIHSRYDTHGNHIFRNILMSPHSNFSAVTTAAALHINSDFTSWPKLLAAWKTALFINDPLQDDPHLGFRNQLPLSLLHNNRLVLVAPSNTGQRLTANFINSTAKTHPLYPGEGVFSFVQTDMPVPPPGSGNIKYIGLYGTEKVTPIPAGGALLTLNINTNFNANNLTSEDGQITGTPPPQSINVQAARSLSFAGIDIERMFFRRGVNFSHNFQIPAKEYE